MIPKAELIIRLTPGWLKPRVGEQRLNAICGGPETLLSWLETQLGLRTAPVAVSSRITEYLNALEKCSNASFERSLASDRWATGDRLLELRDELRLGGWDGDNPSLPAVVRDLGRAAEEHACTHIGESERLARVMRALDDLQSLPPHRCILPDPLDAWPPAWRAVLARLSVETSEEVLPHAAEGCALRSAQAVVRGQAIESITPDNSFRYVSTRSETTACEFISNTLARQRHLLRETVVFCEDDALAMRLDACFNRFGLPTMGASKVSAAHPVLQVLPLLLGLLWEPVDPKILLDFLTLPVSPIPRRAAYRLAECLSRQPGLGSEKWEAALSDLCSRESDPEGKLRKRVDDWLLTDRVSRGMKAATSEIRKRCSLVAQWASGRALKGIENEDTCEELLEALLSAAGHASLLGELVEIQGGEISEPQLSRLLEETLRGGVETSAAPEDAEGPVRVRSLAEIVTPCKRLVWLGLGTADAIVPHWSKFDRASLSKAGIELDDGSKRVGVLRRAEAEGFSYVQDALLGVLLPSDTTRRWHPLWLAVRNALGEANEPIRLEDAIALGNLDLLQPFVTELSTQQVQLPPAERRLWKVPVGAIQDRTKTSASELQVRLACPLKWTLLYQAKLRPSVIAQLPNDFLLKGTFCHDILKRVFGGGGTLPSLADAEARITAAFDERLPLDAAPLAQPRMASERRRLRQELCSATRTLITALSAGGYRIVAIEAEVQATAFGKELIGSIDCLAEREDGREAVIDFKYAGREKYRTLLADGRAVQLAAYAFARSQSAGKNGVYPAVAYLVLAEGRLFVPTGSALTDTTECSMVDGAPIQSVWNQFTASIERAGGWLDGTVDLPARPLQASAEWPQGADIALSANLRPDEQQEVCRYCDYPTLCGLRRLT